MESLRIKEKGWPFKNVGGNLILKVKIHLPIQCFPEADDLFQVLKRVRGEDHRKSWINPILI